LGGLAGVSEADGLRSFHRARVAGSSAMDWVERSDTIN
jgi:hypothetical protein